MDGAFHVEVFVAVSHAIGACACFFAVVAGAFVDFFADAVFG